MTGPEAVAAVLAKAEELAGAQIRARKGGVEAWGEPLAVAQQLEKTPEFAALRSLLPSEELSEGLERYGTYEGLLEGRPHPTAEACWEYLQHHLGQPHAFLSAIEAGGVDTDDGSTDPIDLSSNFFLRRFSEQEIVSWLPPKKYERRRLDPYVTSQYWFIVREGQNLFPQRRRRLNSADLPTYARDRIWDEWWIPYFCLSLFRDQVPTAGVRIEVAPGWGIRTLGEFEGQLVDDEEGRAYWHRFDSGRFLITNEDRAELKEFAHLLIPAVIKWSADPDEGLRFRAIGRSFLRAVWSLPYEPYRSYDLDRIEECLFNLVRAADGALFGKEPEGKLTQKFIKRFVNCAELPEDDRVLLECAYQQRSRLAHAYDAPEIPAVTSRLLWPRVRRCLLGYVGLLDKLGSRAALIEYLNNRSQQADLSKKLWKLARLA